MHHAQALSNHEKPKVIIQKIVLQTRTVTVKVTIDEFGVNQQEARLRH